MEGGIIVEKKDTGGPLTLDVSQSASQGLAEMRCKRRGTLMRKVATFLKTRGYLPF